MLRPHPVIIIMRGRSKNNHPKHDSKTQEAPLPLPLLLIWLPVLLFSCIIHLQERGKTICFLGAVFKPQASISIDFCAHNPDIVIIDCQRVWPNGSFIKIKNGGQKGEKVGHLLWVAEHITGHFFFFSSDFEILDTSHVLSAG